MNERENTGVGDRGLRVPGRPVPRAGDARAARADVAMVSTPRDTPISAYKGTLAWSQWDTVKQQYRLILTTVKIGKPTKPKIGLRKPHRST